MSQPNTSRNPVEAQFVQAMTSLVQMDPDVVVPEPPRFSVETWTLILRNVTRPTDLYHLALTSHYIYEIVKPILYRRLYLDPNHYTIHTLSLLKRESGLTSRITELTLLAPLFRDIPLEIRTESEKLYRTLGIRRTLGTRRSRYPLTRRRRRFTPLFGITDSSYVNWEGLLRPIFHFFPSLTGLSTLIVRDYVPPNFMHWISELPQLTDLDIRDSAISAGFERENPRTPLPLRTLTVSRCWSKSDLSESLMPGKLCAALLTRSPSLTSLTVDALAERAACLVLSEMETLPPIQSFSCHGLSPDDPDGSLLSGTLCALPTITTLKIVRGLEEITLPLPPKALPELTTLTGPLKSMALFLGVQRSVQYLTLLDHPSSSGGKTWETQLVEFFESIRGCDVTLRGLAFKVSVWSEDVFLCVCQLWPGLEDLRIECMRGPGPDNYFRISCGPRFLPRLQALEVLHIYVKKKQLRDARSDSFKGVPFVTLCPLTITPAERVELVEAPIHYRRWEKLCPTLREVAFDSELWWRRAASDPGGWLLTRDIISQESC